MGKSSLRAGLFQAITVVNAAPKRKRAQKSETQQTRIAGRACPMLIYGGLRCNWHDHGSAQWLLRVQPVSPAPTVFCVQAICEASASKFAI